MRRAVFAILSFAVSGAAAHADAIDGEWCSPRGQRLAIAGPDITIPSGAALKGNYSRHRFAYTAPAGDPESGADILMELLDEETMKHYVVRDGAIGQAEVWRRCEVTS
jgi:hypothetical protein